MTRRRQRARSNGVQITRVGVWYLAAGVVVAAAATNTGNNGLFLTVAAMAASVIVSHVFAAVNVGHLRLAAGTDREVFANTPCYLPIEVRNTSRLLPSWLLAIEIEPGDLDPPERRRRRAAPWLLPFLPAGATATSQLELQLLRRGPKRLRFVQASSLFPLGLFRKGRRHPQDAEILVYPEIYSSSAAGLSESGNAGEQAERRPGQGQELHTLRAYRPGDDPRGIHWKQTARQRQLIVQQRQSEKQRRLRIVFDNAIGTLQDDGEIDRFERLVSEAATAAVDALENGYEVSLVTRDRHLEYANGRRQRRQILDILARLEALPVAKTPLGVEENGGVHLRLGQPEQAVA